MDANIVLSFLYKMARRNEIQFYSTHKTRNKITNVDEDIKIVISYLGSLHCSNPTKEAYSFSEIHSVANTIETVSKVGLLKLLGKASKEGFINVKGHNYNLTSKGITLAGIENRD